MNDNTKTRCRCLLERLREKTGVDLPALLSDLLDRAFAVVLAAVLLVVCVCLTVASAVLVRRQPRPKATPEALPAETPAEAPVAVQVVPKPVAGEKAFEAVPVSEEEPVPAVKVTRWPLTVVDAPGTGSSLPVADTPVPPSGPQSQAADGARPRALTVKQLRRRLADAGIKAPARLRKADLFALLP